ncbi:MAG: cytochrome c biogenesis CcdA family protein [Actinomycetota bacterium]
MGPFALALVAGVISFTSPCCLPLMPGYLSYVSGVAGGGSEAVAVRARVVGAAALFVAGFAVVFTLLGASASVLGFFLLRNRQTLIKIAGILVIVMGLLTIGVIKIPFLYREFRIDLRRIRPGPLGAVPLGMAFAIGWTPCIGPVLAGILTAAAATQSVGRGAALLFVYSLGLGIPFILLALGYTREGRVVGWLRRHGRAIEWVGGMVLITMGILMLTGQWLRLFTPLIRWFSRNQWPPI